MAGQPVLRTAPLGGSPSFTDDLDGPGYTVGGDEAFPRGTPHTVPSRYRIASPIAHVHADDPPTYLVHGGDDRLVPLEQSELLAERLQGANVPHRLVKLPWANHSFDHAFDFSWSGSGSQIARSTLAEFLYDHIAAQSDPMSSVEEQDESSDGA